jgi:hypothetical protein
MKSNAPVSNPKKVPHLLLSRTSQGSLARVDYLEMKMGLLLNKIALNDTLLALDILRR